MRDDRRVRRLRRIPRTIASAAIGIGLGMILFFVGLQNAGAGNTLINPAASGVFYCADVCKYHQAKVQYTSSVVNYLSWWGSTASGTCDPSNDVEKWRLDGTSLYNDTSNAKLYGWGPQSWKTNCNIVNTPNPPWAWAVAPNVSRPSNASAHYWWRFYNEGASVPWTQYLRADF